jgi:AAHS family 4-hydroxybenzoate transporter-like MFS transporter
MLTPLFWISNFVAVMSFFSMIQWLPTMLPASGVSVAQAAVAGTLFHLGGTVAGLLSMRLLDKYGFIPVPVLFALAIPLVACMGLPGLPPSVVVGLAAAAGFCLLGLQFGNIGTEANIYPTAIRSWGVASNFAIGRIGGGLGPFLGGIAFGAKLSSQVIFMLASIPLVIGLIVTIAIIPLYSRHTRYLRSGQSGSPAIDVEAHA